MNERDSEALSCLLQSRGYQPAADESSADIIILNTCSVREQAERKAIGKIGLLKRLKRQKPELILGLIGCLAQRRGEELLAELPHLDFITGTDQLQSIPETLAGLQQERRQHAALTQGSELAPELDLHRPGSWLAYVSVMRGCNQFCTYCIVPYTRGREKSRPIPAIVAEVEQLVAGGCREILLLGQNITAYMVAEARQARQYTPEFSAFADLLAALQEVRGLERIRFTSPHVSFMNRKFIETVGSLPKVCKSFHIPVQSGCDRILKLMNRDYSRAEYCEKVAAIRALAPQSTFTTDVIVGFPSETREEFNLTRQLLQEIEYEMAYIFRYSQREGTRAAEILPDDVPEDEKHRRNQLLLEDLAAGASKRNRRFWGQVVEVLVEGESKRNPARWTGRTDLNKVCLFSPRPGLQPGQILPLLIQRSTASSLFGELQIPLSPQG